MTIKELIAETSGLEIWKEMMAYDDVTQNKMVKYFEETFDFIDVNMIDVPDSIKRIFDEGWEIVDKIECIRKQLHEACNKYLNAETSDAQASTEFIRIENRLNMEIHLLACKLDSISYTARAIYDCLCE